MCMYNVFGEGVAALAAKFLIKFSSEVEAIFKLTF